MNSYVKRVGLLVPILLSSHPAFAAVRADGLLDTAADRLLAASAGWGGVITAHASVLFWALATISLVWTFGMMLMRRADIGELFAEFFRFIVFTGFFWWLLKNGPAMAIAIIDSLRTIGAEASGMPVALTPSNLVSIGLSIFDKAMAGVSFTSPIDSLSIVAVSIGITIVLAMIGVNLLITLCSAWVMAYAGVFILGFGGSRWTSDMAIGYFRSVLGIGLQLLTMTLLVGIGLSLIDELYAALSASASIKELVLVLIVAVLLLQMVNRLPSQVASMVSGHGGGGSSSGGFGLGGAMSAAGMAASGVAAAGSAIAQGAAQLAGGASAIVAAIQKAQQSASGGSDLLSSFSSGARGSQDAGESQAVGEGSGTQSPLAAAMGDGETGGSASTLPGIGGGVSSSAGGFTAEAPSAKSTAQSQGSSLRADGGPGKEKSGGAIASLAKAGSIAADAAANLAQGAWSVAQEGAKKRAGVAQEQFTGTTIGGKIAAAIGGPTYSGKVDADLGSGGDRLSAGQIDLAAEVTAFVNKTPQEEA